MFDNILADVPVDGEIFEPETEKKDEQVTDKPAESLTDKSETDKAPSQEGANDGVRNSEEGTASNTSDDSQLPFNKHPRWKEMQEQNASMRNELESLKNTVGSLTPKLDALETQREELKTKRIPKLFIDIYGDNANEAWDDYKKELDAEIQKGQQEVLNQIEAEKRAQVEESQKWNTWMQDSIKNVETTFGVELPDGSSERNEFLKYVLKYKPTDDQGNIDFALGYELFSQLKEVERSKKSEKNSARKNLAATTTSDKGAEPKKPSMNHKTLRSKSFRDLALESLNES